MGVKIKKENFGPNGFEKGELLQSIVKLWEGNGDAIAN